MSNLKNNQTRLFFVVENEEKNEELFETLEDADEYRELETEFKNRMFIALVCNAYYEKDLKKWNYEDMSGTFTKIKSL